MPLIGSQNEQKYQQEQQQRERERQQYEQEKQQFEEDVKRKYQQQESEKEPVDNRNSYEILGVSELATASEIKKAYKKLTMRYHPDRNMHMSESFRKECAVEFKKIKNAYEALTGKKG